MEEMYEEEVEKTKLDVIDEDGVPTFGGVANGENANTAPLLVNK